MLFRRTTIHLASCYPPFFEILLLLTDLAFSSSSFCLAEPLRPAGEAAHILFLSLITS
jgi:hypothetical protein